jgi:hypothetical protein
MSKARHPQADLGSTLLRAPKIAGCVLSSIAKGFSKEFSKPLTGK